MVKRYTKLSAIIIVNILLFTLSGCSLFSGESKPEAVTLTIMLKSSDNINPTLYSKANPVVINLYQLASIESFKSAQALDLFQVDIKVLADALVQKKTLGAILPNIQQQIKLTVQPMTKYLAVYVQFSNYPQAKTKAWLDISKLDTIESINISVNSLTVNMNAKVNKSFWSW